MNNAKKSVLGLSIIAVVVIIAIVVICWPTHEKIDPITQEELELLKNTYQDGDMITCYMVEKDYYEFVKNPSMKQWLDSIEDVTIYRVTNSQEIETDNCNLKTTEGVKKALYLSGDSNVDRSNDVTSTLYFEGDYSQTCDYIEKLKSQPQQYRLLDNNCIQQSVQALQNSKKIFAMTNDVIPNVAYKKATILWEYLQHLI